MTIIYTEGVIKELKFRLKFNKGFIMGAYSILQMPMQMLSNIEKLRSFEWF